MGFGTELQGRESHEALIRLQDAEIRLLENMKKCVSHRIKVDRDYAQALSTIVAIAQRFDNTEFISPIFQSWNTIIKETETLIHVIRTNTDKLCAKTLEKLVQLINEKKASRKFYTDEKHRLEWELQQLQEESQRHKGDYERIVYKVRQDRTKYEDLLLKGKPGGKFDEAKSKYYRSSMKLHKVHNEYVTKLLEVGIHQKNYLKNTLPGLLDFQQGTQESLVEQCKEVLGEYAECTDTSSEDYSKCHKEIHKSIQSISPTTEYKEFVQTHRSDALDVPKLDFDINLLEDYKGTLLANEISVDELTIESAQHSLTTYGDKLHSCKQWKEHKEKELQVLESELSKIASSTEMDENLKNEINTKKRTAQILKREINEFRCNEQKFQTLFDTLNEPIARLGDEDLPAGLELQALGSDGIDMKDKSDTGSVSSQGRSGIGLSAAGLTSKFGALKTTVGAAFKNLKKQGASTPPKPPSKDFIQETETTDKRNGTADSFKNSTRSSDNYQQVSQDDMTVQPNRQLDEEDWFHGVLPREEVQRLLNNDGDYLVRESKNKRTGEIQHVLSVMWHGHKHFIIQSSEEQGGGWRFEGQSFPTIQELIIHQHKSGLPVTNKSQAILSTAILREQWELRNDDINLGAKIGNGNFGDVYRGVYKPRGLEVAVKTCRETLSEDQKKKFLQEGRILKQYDHPNIVKFIGIAAHRNPVMIVMEYVSGGALLNFLRKHGSNQQVKQLVKMCEDASAGMAYLECKNCIHRDLAARNCLVGKNNTVKISDFGMSREEEEYTVSDGLKQIPIKWTAPEALNYGKYTTICDVWSFGILMWEIFSFGGTPYPGLTNSQARDKIDMGYRMPAPDGTPELLYKLMLRCWEYEPDKRPHFDEIYRELQNIRPKV